MKKEYKIEDECRAYEITDAMLYRSEDHNTQQYMKGYSFMNREYEPETGSGYRYRKGDPVATLDADHGHATYQTYGTYRNENRKIRSDRREDYAYYSDQEGRYYYVSVGDSSAADNQPVTAEDIQKLHQLRDREVYHNNKYRFQEETDKRYLQRMEQERQKMLKGLPNDYEWMEEKVRKHRLVVNAETFVDENGDDMTDHMMAFAAPRTVESALGLNSTDLGIVIEEIMSTMTDNEREVFELVQYKQLSRTTVAAMLQVSEGTVRYRLKSAEEKIRANPFIQRCWEKTQKHSARLNTWAQEHKARKTRKKKSA